MANHRSLSQIEVIDSCYLIIRDFLKRVDFPWEKIIAVAKFEGGKVDKNKDPLLKHGLALIGTKYDRTFIMVGFDDHIYNYDASRFTFSRGSLVVVK